MIIYVYLHHLKQTRRQHSAQDDTITIMWLKQSICRLDAAARLTLGQIQGDRGSFAVMVHVPSGYD